MSAESLTITPDSAPDPADRLIGVEELVANARKYNPKSDSGKIRKAYEYGRKKHRGQKRQSGAEYFSHPVAVADFLISQRLDDLSIVTALLHDTLEDTDSSFDEISRMFGANTAKLVEGVTKITKARFSNLETARVANLRSFLLGISDDRRILLVKLADRIHNMRTIKHLRPEKRKRKAHETMEIFAPLAGRLGLQSWREDLEDLAFQELDPGEREKVIERCNSLYKTEYRGPKEADKAIEEVRKEIGKVLIDSGISAEVQSREKRPYSIYRKMQEKRARFGSIFDVHGFRIITESADDVYRSLGVVHRHWQAMQGRFKDYISQPKSNGYRSVHTTVSRPAGGILEIQIRDRLMHEVAEKGDAAHWSYRDGVIGKNPYSVDLSGWLKRMNEGAETAQDQDELMDYFKTSMKAESVFCYTPEGEVIRLPVGATALDFAYAIHTGLGDRCLGAKIDGKREPIGKTLRSGQTVEIIRASRPCVVEAWRDLATTARAKSAISRTFHRVERESRIEFGRDLVGRAFERADKMMTENALRSAAEKLGFRRAAKKSWPDATPEEIRVKSVEAMLGKVGRAEIRGSTVVKTVFPESADRTEEPEQAVIGLRPDDKRDFALCCKPVPGDNIVGEPRRGEGVKIHAAHCPALGQMESTADWIELRWHGEPSSAYYTSSVDITLANQAGVLGRICTLIGKNNSNISDLEFVDRKPDYYRMLVDLEVRNLAHLEELLKLIRADGDIAEASRHRPEGGEQQPP